MIEFLILWTIFAIILSLVFLLQPHAKTGLEQFKNHIRECVIEKKCIVGESSIHFAREKLVWFLISHFGHVGAFIGLWFSYFLLTFFLPYFLLRVWYFRNESLAKQFYPL